MIDFENVNLDLGSQHFLFDVRIETGSLTMVTGASGSGKTTFLNLLAGFEEPLTGKISIGGVSMAGVYPGERPISLVFQDNNLFSHLTVETNIALGIRPSGSVSKAEKDQIAVALKDVDLSGFEKRMPSTLSGGERQRVAFARALVQKRPVMALDEPFAALDPGMRRDTGQLLAELHRRENNTVVMVTHNPDDVLALATHVIFLDKGQVLFFGSASDFSNARGLESIQRFLNGELLP